MTHGTTITDRLGTIFTETFHIEVPSPETDLLESGILDSFQFVELLLQLERHFKLHIQIDDIDLEDLRTLARVARLVQARRETSEAPPMATPSIAAD